MRLFGLRARNRRTRRTRGEAAQRSERNASLNNKAIAGSTCSVMKNVRQFSHFVQATRNFELSRRSLKQTTEIESGKCEDIRSASVYTVAQ